MGDHCVTIAKPPFTNAPLVNYNHNTTTNNNNDNNTKHTTTNTTNDESHNTIY